MSKFTHRPLTSAQLIRLIVLQPSLSYTHPIRCSLIDVHTSSRRRYDALSYTWESQKPSQPIYCDGKEFYVTPNVDAALRRLRGRVFHRRLWIDAICINQKDHVERAEQVGLMEEIFATARRVVVWLGDDTSNETRRAIRTLKWVYPMFKVALSIWPLRHYFLPYFNRIKLGFQKALWRAPGDLRVRERHQGLCQLLHHDWYRRIWTIQEVALARRILIVCGESRIGWPALTRVLTTFDQAFSKPRVPRCVSVDGGYNPHQPVYRGVPFISRIQEIQVLRSWVSPSEKKRRRADTRARPPISLVFNAILKGLNPDYSATMRLDRIYGMFGVLRGLGIELPAADYERCLVEVVFQVLCQISRHYRSIQILQFATGEHSLNGLPSWIPDYSIVPWSTTQSGQGVGAVEFEQNGTVLSVRGKCLDIIAAVSSTISHVDFHSSFVTQAFDLSIPMFQAKIRDWLEFINATRTYQGCSQMDIIRHVFRLFIHPQVEICYDEAGAVPWAYFNSDRLHLHFAHWLADVLYDTQKTLSSHGWDNNFDQVPHFLSSEAVLSSHRTEFPYDFDNTFHLHLSDIGYPRAISVLQRWVREYVAQKRLFRTASGKIGISWQSVREGDVVVAVHGLEDLLLLRKRDDGRYTTLGPCNIPTMPRDMLWTGDECTTRSQEKFNIV